MKTYRVTIRLNVETAVGPRQLEREMCEWLDAQLSFWAKAGIPASVSSVTAFEDVLIQERAA